MKGLDEETARKDNIPIETGAAASKRALRQNVRRNFNRFEKEQLSHTQKNIFDNAGTIRFYQRINKFLRSGYELAPEVTEFLNLQGETVIDKIFDFFDGDLSIQSDENIDYLLSSYYESSLQNKDLAQGRRIISEFDEYMREFTFTLNDGWAKEIVATLNYSVQDKLSSLEPAQRKDYLASMRNTARAGMDFLREHGYLCGTDGLSDTYFIQEEALSGFLWQLEYPENKHVEFPGLTESYALSISSYTQGYGFSREQIAKELDKKIAKFTSENEM